MPVIGWRRRAWRRGEIECVACPARITEGTTHVNDRADPPERAMCDECYRRVMADAEHFEDVAGPVDDLIRLGQPGSPYRCAACGHQGYCSCGPAIASKPPAPTLQEIAQWN